MVEAAAYAQVMTVAFEVVPFVHIHPVTLVRHNLLTKANAKFAGGPTSVQFSVFEVMKRTNKQQTSGYEGEKT